MTWKPKPPPVDQLNYAQHSGWRCCWCNKSLMGGARSAGISRGSSGVHVLDIEVYECGPRCPKRPRPPRRRPPKKDSQEGTP
ncbi:hypothetical protein [Streptomyces cupreus]|uniref:Uncharacterized protein n=1 Tax=Streptomyces cupreus TaxID=2759956 RepID=A0A7X1J3I2_9ACTN|nr:hypothetical protein [Streptomyces cupreus]MBC2903540.1 hypothetical protein [Streptomyces cupreus]